MERKVLIASILATFGFCSFLLGYFFINQKNAPVQTGSLIDRFNANSEIKKAADNPPRILPVSSRKLVAFVVPPSNSQKIVAADKSGVIVEISIQDLRETVVEKLKSRELASILLAPSGNSIFYSSYDGGGKNYFYLDLKEGEPVEMGKNIKSSVFSSYDDQLLYLSGSGEEEALYVLKNKAVKKILNTRLNNAALSWPSKFISLLSYGEDKDGYGDLLILEGEGRLNKIISYQKDLTVKWSPSAQKLLFSAKDSSNAHRLYHQEFGKDKGVDLKISADASRCAWLADETSVICGITDDSTFRDKFYKINIADRSINIVAAPSTNLITKEIALDRSGSTIFVLNEIDSKLYSLKIE